MRQAIAVAREGIAKGQSPFGACIVKGGAVVACAHNGVWEETDPTAHAEVRAIRAACRELGTINLSGCVIYSTCEPCAMCFSACHWAKLDRIVYGAGISDAAARGFSELLISDQDLKERAGSPVLLTPDVLRDECLEVFQKWAAGGEKRVY
ncbi:MAG: nucleoside deaminase [Armatimonadetes bacterium]|nr:nucleoside deaminase [Armatimonadota bacterium]